MPGVGDLYEPKQEWLKGLAITISSNQERSRRSNERIRNCSIAPEDAEVEQGDSSSVYFKYFPREALPLDASERFSVLFKEQSIWKLKDLEPYLEDLVSAENCDMAELLLMHAQSIEAKDGGEQRYTSKK